MESPPANHALITPSDSADLPVVIRGFSIPTAGAIKFTDLGGNIVTVPSGYYAPGMIHPARWVKIWNTDTDAASILVVW